MAEQKRRERRIVALKAFIDDSGTKGTGKVLVLGGLMGSAEALADIADRWERELRSKVPLPIAYFKAAEARGMTGEFADWSRKSRDQKVLRLSSIIDRDDVFMIQGAVALVPHRHTEQVIGKLTDAKFHPLNQPYLLALLLAMLAVTMEAARRRLQQKVEVVVDEHVIFRKDALAMWEMVREISPPHLREFMPIQPLFRDDREFVVLQAADLLMGHERMFVEKVSRWPQIEFKKLMSSPFSGVADAKKLGGMTAREIERRLNLSPNSLRVSVRPLGGGERA